MDTVLPILCGGVNTGHTERVKAERPPSAALPKGRSRGRPSISPERFVAAALDLIASDGAQALSMRTLAQRLDSGTATLYRHFGGRAQLVADVVDAVFGEAALDIGDLANEPWQRSCEKVAHAMYAALGDHPGVAQLLLEHIPVGPNAMVIREASLNMLLQNGFPPALAVRSYATLSRYVLGFAIQASASPDRNAELDAELFRGIDLTRFPATLAVADSLPVELEEEFAFGLGLIIDGLSRIR